jgi:hypothetical protein
MSLRRFVSACLLAGLLAFPGLPAEVIFRSEPGQIVLAGDSFAIGFADTNGSILNVTGGSGTSVLRGSPAGLWQAFLLGGGTIRAAGFRAGSAQNTFAWSLESEQGPLRLFYTNAQVAVSVTVSGLTNGADFTATVEPRGSNVLTEFALPARLQFAPEDLSRLVGALNSSDAVGAAFKEGFFRAQPPEAPAGWQTRVVGPSGYISLFGGPLVSRADNDPPTSVSVTPDGRAWLGDALADRLQGAAAVVNRPSTRSQTPLVLADSTNGPYFSGSQLGGSGWLFRVGGSVGTSESGLVQDLVTAALEHWAGVAPPGRTRVGLVALTRGPSSGGWAGVSVAEWRTRLRASTSLAARGVEVLELTHAGEVLAALGTTNLLALLNPYGEWTPVLEQTGMSGMVAAVRGFVRAGGCWIETGGYPFYYELRPAPFFSYESPYPPAFADFLHVETTAGRASVYGVQPQIHAPWSGATDPATVFVPGRLAWGGESGGGYCERHFGTFIPGGQRWRSPSVRLVLGPSVEEALAGYAAANRLERRLDQKWAPELLAPFKRSVLVYYGGSCAEKSAHLGQLPVPTLIHFADYLKGGFDKEYPDHLPPGEGFGTTNELRAFLDRCRSLGHLAMPYTNPTWWCDHPRGPTFLREGEAPLLRRLDGSLAYERYDANDGYTVCHWHPAVRAANATTLRQFTEEFPIDVLFQDQCGARTWQYDLNPASPAVHAYADGLCSMVAEDARSRPLSTENGWDRLLNHEAQFCGLTWGIVPTEDPPAWRVMMHERFPPALWEIFPLAQILAHDKVAMVHHDLGQFVSNDEVLAWTLGLGYGLSLRVGAAELDRPRTREWLRWLARLQQSIGARYLGEAIGSFAHERLASSGPVPRGILRATYGPVSVRANLGPEPLAETGRVLAGHGFDARAPGLVAGRFAKVGTHDFGPEGVAFVCEGTARQADFWIYSPGDRSVAIEVPEPADGSVRVQLDGESPGEARMQAGVVPVDLRWFPGGARPEPPQELAGRAPRDWPAGKPAIGVLDLPGFPQSWTSITPADWEQALTGSRPATEWGAPIRRITTTNALVSALAAGPTVWLALINPAGEHFPLAAPGAWQSMLGLVRDYVNRGGSWWETAGYSFYAPAYFDGAAWRIQPIGPSGMSFLGLPVGSGDVAQPPEMLSVTTDGRAWLGEALASQLSGLTSSVNRGLPRTLDDPGHLAILAGAQTDFLGGYRLEGWGFLWRVGGFHPNRAAVMPAVVGIIDYLYTHPPLPVPAPTTSYLWHGTVAWNSGAVLRAWATPPAGVTVVAAECPPGAVNTLERAHTLDPAHPWEEVLRFDSPPQQTNWVDPDAGRESQTFYRVRSTLGR